MKIERAIFLAFATSMAATACSAAPAGDDVDEGAVEQAACTAAGADSVELATNDIVFCDELANGASRRGEDHTSVYRTCLGYLSSFKSAPAAKARSCMQGLGAAPTSDFWTKLYGCGYESLEGSCVDDAARASCATLTSARSAQWTRTGSTSAVEVRSECEAFMSGLEKKAREQVESCVKQGPFPVYSCVEGIDPTFAKTCISPGADPGRRREIDARARCTEDHANPAAQSLCVKLVGNAQPDVAAQIIDNLAGAGQSATLDEEAVYRIGTRTLHEACRQPADVDALCAAGVRALVSNGASNAGGRLTNECRSLLAGLKPEARQQLKNLMEATQNGGEITRAPGGLSRLVKLLVPCLDPHPDVCLDDSLG